MNNENAFCNKRLFDLLPKVSIKRLEEMLDEAGYHMDSNTIGRLKRGERDLKVNELLMFSKVFKFSPEEVLRDEEQSAGHTFIPVAEGFFCDPNLPEFNGYLGDYRCWFYSTAQEEKGRLIGGQLSLKRTVTEAGQGYCKASVLLSLENEREKNFEGTAVISRLGVIWITLTAADKGDFSVIALRYRPFDSDCICRMGLVLTVSAGDLKIPAVGKIFIARMNCSDENAESILSVLKMELSTLRVPREKWDQWRQAHPELADGITARTEGTCLIDLHTLVKRVGMRSADLEELMSYAVNEDVLRLTEAEDGAAYMLLRDMGRP